MGSLGIEGFLNATLESRMAKKRPARRDQPEQLVLPFQLRVGDVILEDGTCAEVVGRPTGMSGGKLMHAWLLREGETVRLGGVAEGSGRSTRRVGHAASAESASSG